MKEIIKKLIFWKHWRHIIKSDEVPGFESVDKSGFEKRKYRKYDDYLKHQSEKLTLKYEGIEKYDTEYEKVIKNRYADKFDFNNTSMLCLAARLGGEVRAFKSLGSLAIGVDIEPGAKNEHVLYGDFHSLAFKDNTFDFVFTNALDHAFDLQRFFTESHRVLKKGGLFILELGNQKPGAYESIDTSNHDIILKIAQSFFKITDQGEMNYKIEFVDWTGRIYLLEKK